MITILIQLLADDFARNGFKIYAPDLFEGDQVPPDAFSTVRHPLLISLSCTRAHKKLILGDI